VKAPGKGQRESDISTPTATRLRLAPFGYGTLARPVACETLSLRVRLLPTKQLADAQFFPQALRKSVGCVRGMCMFRRESFRFRLIGPSLTSPVYRSRCTYA